jgi:hypothetical protein
MESLDSKLAYPLDDGPLTEKQIAALREDAAKHYPHGKLICRQSLVEELDGCNCQDNCAGGAS